MNKIKALKLINTINNIKDSKMSDSKASKATDLLWNGGHGSKDKRCGATCILYAFADRDIYLTFNENGSVQYGSKRYKNFKELYNKYEYSNFALISNKTVNKIMQIFETHDSTACDELDDADIDELIAEEYEAIADYDEALKVTTNAHAREQLEHIRAEEVEHVKELEELKAKQEPITDDVSPMTYAKLKEKGYTHKDWEKWSDEEKVAKSQEGEKSGKKEEGSKEESSKEKVYSQYEELPEDEDLADYQKMAKKYGVTIEKTSKGNLKVSGSEKALKQFYEEEIGVDFDINELNSEEDIEKEKHRYDSVNDMAFNKAGEYKPAHNVYHNDWTPEQLRERLIRADKAGQQTILEGLLSTLESDIKADLNNGSLDKQETKKHYQKYVDMLKRLSLPGYYQKSIDWSLKRISYLGLH